VFVVAQTLEVTVELFRAARGECFAGNQKFEGHTEQAMPEFYFHCLGRLYAATLLDLKSNLV